MERVLEYYTNQTSELELSGKATAIFLDEVTKHSRTRFIAAFPHALELLEAARLNGREAFEKRMRSWDVRN